MSVAALLVLAMLGASADPDLRAAEQAYDDGQFDAVLPAVDRALLRPLSSADRVHALSLRAMTHAAFNRNKEALSDFRAILAEDPDFALPASAGHKLNDLLQQARAEAPRKPKPPALEPAPAPAPPPVPREALSEAPRAAEEPALWERPWVWVGAAVVTVVAVGTAASFHHQLGPGSLGAGTLQ